MSFKKKKLLLMYPIRFLEMRFPRKFFIQKIRTYQKERLTIASFKPTHSNLIKVPKVVWPLIR